MAELTVFWLADWKVFSMVVGLVVWKENAWVEVRDDTRAVCLDFEQVDEKVNPSVALTGA